jgi:hypothetical protein
MRLKTVLLGSLMAVLCVSVDASHAKDGIICSIAKESEDTTGWAATSLAYNRRGPSGDGWYNTQAGFAVLVEQDKQTLVASQDHPGDHLFVVQYKGYNVRHWFQRVQKKQDNASLCVLLTGMQNGPGSAADVVSAVVYTKPAKR